MVIGTIAFAIASIMAMYAAGKGFDEIKKSMLQDKQFEFLREQSKQEIKFKEKQSDSKQMFMAMMMEEKRRQERKEMEILPAMEAQRDFRRALINKTMQPSRAPEMLMGMTGLQSQIGEANKRPDPATIPTGILQLLRY